MRRPELGGAVEAGADIAAKLERPPCRGQGTPGYTSGQWDEEFPDFQCASSTARPIFPAKIMNPLHHCLAVFLCVLVGAVMSGCASAAPAAPKTLRVLTYNIHHGEGLDGKVDLVRISELITNLQADVVCLNEVDKGVTRTKGRDLTAELAALTRMTGVFSNNYHFQGGEYGNAILTRYPVISSKNTHYTMLRPGEQRGILQVRIDAGGREVVFMATHIDYRPDDTERLMNVDEIFGLLPRYSGKTVIVAGDFNDTPGKRVHSKMKERFRDAWEEAGPGDGLTIPVKKPTKRIDYIWLEKNAPLKVKEIAVPYSEASDHLPLFTVLEWR